MFRYNLKRLENPTMEAIFFLPRLSRPFGNDYKHLGATMGHIISRADGKGKVHDLTHKTFSTETDSDVR